MFLNLYKSTTSFLQKRFYIRLYRKSFHKCGKNVVLYNPLKIEGEKFITIEDNVKIHYKTWLEAAPLIKSQPLLYIGEGSVIGRFNHIYATDSIIIGKNVLTADKVYISDNIHEYSDINIPILKQGIRQKNKVTIGDGTWIGENVCIVGVSIGRNCVIGANSVVTKDIPDYSIAAGNPARTIKCYNAQTKEWEKNK